MVILIDSLTGFSSTQILQYNFLLASCQKTVNVEGSEARVYFRTGCLSEAKHQDVRGGKTLYP